MLISDKSKVCLRIVVILAILICSTLSGCKGGNDAPAESLHAAPEHSSSEEAAGTEVSFIEEAQAETNTLTDEDGKTDDADGIDRIDAASEQGDFQLVRFEGNNVFREDKDFPNGVYRIEVLRGAKWIGTVTAEDARLVTIKIDETSYWEMTCDTMVGVLEDAIDTMDRIDSNGFNLYYDSSLEQNSALNCGTYMLNGKGFLAPII